MFHSLRSLHITTYSRILWRLYRWVYQRCSRLHAKATHRRHQLLRRKQQSERGNEKIWMKSSGQNVYEESFRPICVVLSVRPYHGIAAHVAAATRTKAAILLRVHISLVFLLRCVLSAAATSLHINSCPLNSILFRSEHVFQTYTTP